MNEKCLTLHRNSIKGRCYYLANWNSSSHMWGTVAYTLEFTHNQKPVLFILPLGLSDVRNFVNQVIESWETIELDGELFLEQG